MEEKQEVFLESVNRKDVVGKPRIYFRYRFRYRSANCSFRKYLFLLMVNLIIKTYTKGEMGKKKAANLAA